MDEVKSFMIGGSETGSNFLVALILFVFEKPEVAQKLKREIDLVIRSDEDITVENMKKLSYLECIILEVKRKFGVLPGCLQRELIEDTLIGGVGVRKGTLIDTNWMSISYKPEIFEDPFEFILEWWQRADYKEKQQLVSMVFSSGPRNFIGKNLALFEVKVMTIKLIKRYEKVIEHNIKDRAYNMPFALHIKNCQASLIKSNQ